MAKNNHDNLGDMVFGLSIFSYEWKLKKVKDILTLAEKNKEMSGLLHTAGILLMATILEMVTSTIISMAAQNTAKHHDIPLNKVPEMAYKGKPLTSKMFAVPEIMTSKKYTLDRQNKHVEKLFELVNLRNKICHTEDYSIIEKVGSNKLEVTVHRSNNGAVSLDIAGIKLPDEPWLMWSIEREVAYSCYEALEKYIKEIVDVYHSDPAEVDYDSIINSELITDDL